MPSFFPADTATKRALPMVPKCGACGLYTKCNSPKIPVYGKGKLGVMIIGEAPGETEDQVGKPFQGNSGRFLRDTLRSLGIDMHQDCWITNSLICRPMDENGNNRPPDYKEIDYCRPNMIKSVEELSPKTIILLGASAVKSFIGWVWKENPGEIGRWVGMRIPLQKKNAWICPTYHPSYVMREDKNAAVQYLFTKHLKRAFAKKTRPWEKVPHYLSKTKNILDPEQAAKAIRSYLDKDVVAFDYETTGLKPDSERMRIVSCSISDGERTIAYPWIGEAIRATRELLRSPVGKIASNQKFEERWSIAKLGTRVRNWKWDTMLAAHTLDNREGISSIKFQAFSMLGEDIWDNDVKPYLEAHGGNGMNRINELDIRKLLVYNGMDSLMEYLVAHKQMKMVEKD